MTEEQTPQQEKQLRLLGRHLINRYFVLLKTAQYYGERHEAMAQPVAQLLSLMQEFQGMHAEAVIRQKSGCLFLDDLRLRADSLGFEAFRFTAGILQSYFIRSITFLHPVTGAEIARFAHIFTEIPPVPSLQTFTEFHERLNQSGIRHIIVESMIEGEELAMIDETIDLDNQTKARRIYARALREVTEIIRLATSRRPLPFMRSKRIVQHLVDQLMADESHLLAMTTIRSDYSYTSNHPVNVAILSLEIGRRVGLARSRLCHLGLAALYHDIGKTLIGDELLNAEGEFSDDQEALYRQHPLLGVKLLMELKPLDALVATMIEAAFEHHLLHDGSGYPRLPWKKQGLFSRIIAIANDYDSMASSRVHDRVAHAPDAVIRLMLSPSCTRYDPVLLKLFVNAMGIYPIGTLILLESRELAVVTKNNPDPAKWMLPAVRIVAGPSGAAVDGDLVNLADSAAGRSIVTAIDPHPFGIDVSRYVT